MKGGLGMMTILLLVVVAVVEFTARPSAAAVTCNQVDTALAPCLSYLTQQPAGGGAPSQQCCDGLRSIKAMTPARPDRQMACSCVKQAVGRFGTVRDDAAAALPGECGVSFGVVISRNIDCTKM